MVTCCARLSAVAGYHVRVAGAVDDDSADYAEE